MGLIQNKVTVSQPNSHVVVKNAGGLRGLTGETGPQGPQGVPGEAATVTAGTTTTLPAGSDATVQNVGSTSAAIFNFGIPKGDKGDTGESGAAATISVGTTTTLEPGEDATVTNTGTSSAAVFDFGIPKGDKGDTGATGADGYSPSATVTKTGDTATITITDKDGTTTASISDGSTPTVNDGTLTIQKNGTTVQTFSADQASNVTANITVPTQLSELSGTVSSSQIEDEAITTGSVSGTGTNITLAGTMEGGAIESVELNGDTEQTTYSGKNLLNLVPVSSTSNGITTTLNADGSLTCSGTASDTWANVTATTALPQTLSASDVVVFSIQASIPAQLYARTLVSSPYQRKDYIINAGNTSSSSSAIGMAADSVYLFLNNLTVGTTYNFTIKQAQLEKSSSPTFYEPYVGGTASPNPDYPQEVQTVTGEQNVWVHAKNLFNVSLYDGITQNTDGTVKSTKYYTNSTAVSLHLEPSTRYTISIRNSNGELNGQGWGIAVNGTWINTTSGTGAVTTDANGDVTLTVGASSYGAIGGYNAFFQLEKGSSATTYEPYKGVTKTVNLGKNLFDKDNFPSLDGFIRADNYTLTSSASNKTTYIKADPNTTYTFSGFSLGVALVVGTFNKVPALGDVANVRVLKGASDTTVTITTGTSDSYIAFMYKTSSDTLDTSAFQIEKGSTATTYAPYFTPIELCKIGTYQDYIYKSGEDWYVKKNIGKSAMGSLTWNPASTGTSGVYRMYSDGITSTVLIPPTGSEIAKIICSHYTPETAANTWSAMVGVAVQTTDGRLFVYDSNYNTNTSQSAFTTWLTNNSVVVYYALATPTDTQITNATLISELEDLLSATTYSGTTYITVSGDLASPLEVVAEADSKLAPDSVYGAAIKDGAVSVDKIADLKALADALAPYLNS